MAALPWLIASYLLGAVPTSYLAARLFRGIDLREHGSRNLGAMILRGDRNLTIDHIRTLSRRFSVAADLFIQPKK